MQRRRHGDRRDGVWLRDLDPLHSIVPYLMPNRADNEAFIREKIDISNINAYLEKKNSVNPEIKYKLFDVIVMAMVKAVCLRPRMNRFIKGNRIYQRNDLSVAFVVKKRFHDDAHEALAFKVFDENTTIDSFHSAITAEINACRSDSVVDNSTRAMSMLFKIPRFILRPLIWLLRCLDYYGKVPYSLVKTDPNYASIFISNLGSIKLNAAYHHLNNWGTNSLFLVIGAKYEETVRIGDAWESRPMLDLGFTLDERIADGYYYSQTIKLVKHLLQNPELLELPAGEEVVFDA